MGVNSSIPGLEPGTIVGSRCRIIKCLGVGSMGVVYSCDHRDSAHQLLALKVLFPSIVEDPVSIARFRNEIVAAFAVKHPNIVRAYEYFREGEIFAYTMDYISGGDLRKLIHGDRDLSLTEIIRVLSELGSGVQAIHDANIVHRDLKPENILLTPNQSLRITDFGIAKRDHWREITASGGVLGTLDYVSPEYFESGTVNQQSDIFAMGVIAYELITGTTPFVTIRGKSLIEMISARVAYNPPPPSQIRPDCPEALDRIVLKAMSRNPLERYHSAGAFTKDVLDLQVRRNFSKSTFEADVFNQPKLSIASALKS